MAEQNNNWHFDLTGLKVKEFQAIMAINLTNPASFEAGVPILANRVKNWPYEADPADPASYEELDFFEEWRPMITALAAAVEQRVKQLGK